MVFLVAASFFIGGLPLRFSGNAHASRALMPNPVSMRPTATPTTTPATAAVVQATQPTYDLCLQDDSNRSTLFLNSATGDYIFTCGNCTKKTGKGTLTVKGCTLTLQHNPADRRLSANIDKCAKTGTASLQSPPGTVACSIRDTNKAPDACSNDLAAPQVSITAPNGGEVVDTGSGFTISWNATDDVAVTSQDVQLSTDGGTSFSTIAAGLAGSVNQYSWTAPASANNQSVRVRVVARDSACNLGNDDSDANFILWNPGRAYTHAAEAPIYIAQGGFISTAHLTNTSSDPVDVELDFHKPTGDATPKLPLQFTLQPDEARTVNVADYLTPATPADPGDPNILMGSVRLRHNGVDADAVRGVIAVSKNDEEESFVTPFVDPAAAYSSTNTMLCAPMFYLDAETTAYLALQNALNSPVTVGVKLVYGTGEANTPNGSYNLPDLAVGAQQNLIINLANFRDELQGAKWGSIIVSAPARSVVPHTVMVSGTNSLAFDSGFCDPAMCAGTTKVASLLKLDYDTNVAGCFMVSNMSATDTRVVTATFQTDNGTVIPSRQLTLAPGQQSLVELDPRQLLSAGQSTMAEARLTYSGNASDIIAGAVSMSPTASMAIPASFGEARPTDKRRLISPLFKINGRTTAVVRVSNLDATAIKAGVAMKFADTSLPPLTTDLVTVPARGAATIELRRYLNQVPDGVNARGRAELFHNGAGGSVSASLTVMGVGTTLSQTYQLKSGADFPANMMVMFPNTVPVQSGTPYLIGEMSGGETGEPTWSATAPTGGGGTFTPVPSEDPGVHWATYTPPSEDAEPDTVTISVTSPSGSVIGTATIEKVKLRRIETSNAQGLDTGGRLNPEGDARPTGRTRFRLVGKKEFPDGPLQVQFRQDDFRVSTDVSRDPGDPKAVLGLGPPNSLFIGDAQIVVCIPQPDGSCTKISKDKTGGDEGTGAYYAFDPPAPATASTPDGFDRLGGILTITAQEGGYKQFASSITQSKVSPRVTIGGIDFDVNTVSLTQLTGQVKRAGGDIDSCIIESISPCKRIFVTNPGGRSGDKVKSLINLYNLKAGPAPTPQFINIPRGPSVGGTEVTIRGDNLDWVKSVKFDRTPGRITLQEEGRIKVVTPAQCFGSIPITIDSIDRQSVPFGSFTYVNTLQGPLLDGLPSITVELGKSRTTLRTTVTIGPCETLEIVNPPGQGENGCVTATMEATQVSGGGLAPITFAVFVTVSAKNCNTIASVGNYTFTFTVRNGPVSRRLNMPVEVQ